MIESWIVASPWTSNAESAPEIETFERTALPLDDMEIPPQSPAPVEPRLVDVSVVMKVESAPSRIPSTCNQYVLASTTVPGSRTRVEEESTVTFPLRTTLPLQVVLLEMVESEETNGERDRPNSSRMRTTARERMRNASVQAISMQGLQS